MIASLRSARSALRFETRSKLFEAQGKPFRNSGKLVDAQGECKPVVGSAGLQSACPPV